MTNSSKHTDIEKEVIKVVEEHILQTLISDIWDLYFASKPWYIPKFIYTICLKSFMYVEYKNPGKITQLMESGTKLVVANKKHLLEKHAQEIGYKLKAL